MARIPVLWAIEEFDQLYQFPDFDLHPLTGDRQGQFAIKLTSAWRLIIQHYPDEGEIYVVEVRDYHR